MSDGPTQVDDIDLAAAIIQKLQSHGSVPATITLDVSNGIVTLEGDANSGGEVNAAISLVRSFTGVRGIVNAVTIRRLESA